MRIEQFDPVAADEADALAYAGLIAAARASSTPEGLRQPAEYVLNRLRNMPPDHITSIWTAWDGDALVGAVELFWWEMPTNRNRAWVHFDVPAYSEEVVSTLGAVAAGHATAHGRTLLNVETPRDSELDAWVSQRGGKLGSVEEHNVTRLASLDRSDIAALAAARPEGYELLSFDTRCPDDLVEPYVTLIESMNDAPRDDLTMEDWTFTPEKVRMWEDGIVARGHTCWTVIARSMETGELAGFNQLVVHPEWPEMIQNEDTAVTEKHRGHGLGLWVKAVNLLRVLDERPEAVCVETWNAASNTHMLRVNRRLGFACEHVWNSWELDASAV